MAQPISIADVRQKFPQYKDMSDEQLAQGLHKKFYSDMPYEEFSTKIGLATKQAPQQEDTWSNAIKNVGEAGAHLATGIGGSVLGDAVGLAAIPADILGKSVESAASEPMPQAAANRYAAITKRARGLGQTEGLDPTQLRDAVSGALTYAPENKDSLSMKIAQAPGKVIGGAGEYLQQQTEKLGIPYLDRVAGALPLAAASAIGIKGAQVARGMPVPAGKMGNLSGETIYKAVPKTSVVAAQVPTTDELKKAAGAAYKRADDAGIAVKAESFDAMKARLAKDLEVEGLDATLHPQATAALKRITDATGPQTLQQMETLRRIARDAADTFDNPANARKANSIIDAIDDFVDNMPDSDLVSGNAKDAVALKEARSLYTRKSKAESIERLISRADLSPSGFENGLRIEFRALAKNDRQMRRYTAEEQAAIRKVAKGGAVENSLRLLGKAAPTGIVSGALSGGAGMALGGPIGAAAALGGGAAARQAAKMMTKRNAERAAMVMRRGPQTTGDVPAKLETAPPAAQSKVLPAGTELTAPQAKTRSATAIQNDIRRLSERARLELAREPAGSPKIQAFSAELARLQNELQATLIDQ